MIKSFKKFLWENSCDIAIVLIESNLPSHQHSTIIKEAKYAFPSSNYRIYVLSKSNAKSHSLSEKKRLKYFRKAFREHSRLIFSGQNKSETVQRLESDGYKNIKIFEDSTITEDTTRFIIENEFKSFLNHYPLGNENPNTLFNKLREDLQLKKVRFFREHIDLPSRSTKRERYVAGEIFQPGSIVRENLTNRVIEIAECKSNFVIDTKGCKYFIESLEINEKDDTYKPPAGAKAAAKKALKWKEQHGDEVKAMTQTGWTRANQLASGESLSYDTVKRMAAFARHKKNSKIDPQHKDEPWKDNGHVAWLGWGGDAGIEWAQKIVDSQKNEEYGAGFEGTDGLLANYLDQTPHSKITHWPDTYKTFDDLRKEEDEDDPVFNTK